MKKSAFEKTVASLQSKGLDFRERSIPYMGGTVKIFYIEQLTDRPSLSENVIKPLILHCSQANAPVSPQQVIDAVIYADDCRVESDINRIEEFILAGLAVILFSTDDKYIVINYRKVEHRPVPTPQITYTLRGPQDCFTESLDANLSLIRYRLKDQNMRINSFQVGTRTKTRVAVIYIQDIANDTVVTEIQKRIQNINVDGIGESGELQTFLMNNKLQYLPNMGLIERSDMAFHSLLEGKVLVLVDGSGIALVAPKTFSEFFATLDDRYDNKFFGMFARFIRYVSVFIALTGSSLYVAITAFHTDVLPSDYAIFLAEMRVKGPFDPLTGALIMEFVTELIREALLRVPKQIGPAIGIVGAIVIGQAAISAGIFSPLLLIIVSISLMASFAISDYSLISPFRVLKFILLLLTGMLGFFGAILCVTAVLADLVSLNSFGVPYMAPWAPYNSYDFTRTIMQNTPQDPLRPKYLRTKNKRRLK